MPELVSIIIPAHNQLEYTRQCLETLRTNTRTPYQLILIDNGSTDGSAEHFDAVPDATVVHAETNLGFAKAVNLGLAHVQGHAVLLNNDTLLPRNWLEPLTAALRRSGDIGMVGPKTNYAPGPQQIDGLEFHALEEISAFALQLAESQRGRLTDTYRLVAFCVLIRDTVVKEVGVFDERFGLGNFEDDDYCLRVARAGYRLVIAEDAFVFHYGNRTFARLGVTNDAFQKSLAENQQRLFDKWGRQALEHTEQAHQARVLNRQARAVLEKGDAPEAIRLLKSAIETFPWLAVNYNDLGVALWHMGRPDEAFRAFAHAVRLDPSLPESRANLQDIAANVGRVPEAQNLLKNPGER